MNTIQLSKTHLKPIALLIVSGLLFSVTLWAQPTIVGSSSNPTDGNNGSGATLAVTPPGATPQIGDLVIIYAQYRGNVTLSMSATGGQTWNTATTVADASNSISFAIFWTTFNGTWAANPSVTAGAGNTLPLSVVMYVFRPTVSGSTWGIHVPATNSTATDATAPYSFSITGVTTTVPNTVTMAFWASADDNTWGNLAGTGWSKTSLNAQYRNGSGSDQSNTAAYNIQTNAGATGDVSQNQNANGTDFTRTSIISWYEITATSPANDICSNAISINSGASCSSTSGTLIGATNTSLPSCNGTNPDVWYSFTAQTTNPTITLGGTLGTNGRFQVFSGTCGTLNSEFCSTSASQATSGLTIGATYFVRVYSATVSNDFTVCIVNNPPANNASTSATSLTPGITCAGTTGNLYLATFTSGTPTINNTSCVSGTITADVWYSFVAPIDVVAISLSGAGSDVTGVELLSGTTASMYSMACGGPSGIPAAAVVAGTTYYIRVYSTATITSSLNAGFSICVTATAPANDDCSGAINLNVNSTCNKVYGTVSLATLSTGFGTTGTCTGSGTAAYDVWYKFTATSTTSNITLADFGGAFTGTRRSELYSGTCGSLTALNQCGTPSISATGLTVGTTYYIRVYSTSAPTTGDGKFSICVTSGTASNVRIGNSYVNLTRKTSGGVVQPGDVLEIRMTVWVGSGTLYNTRYLDNIPTNTQWVPGTVSDSIRIITNEGLTYKRYDPLNDTGRYIASPPPGDYNIRLNLGLSNTTANWPGASLNNSISDLTGAGNLPSTANPRGGSGLMFATSFRVEVSGNPGDIIQLDGGKFIYQATDGGTDIPLSGTPYQILISDPLSLCSNSVGVNNATESGGTFGSGNTMNRSYDLATPIAGYTFVQQSSAQAVGDGTYAIVNNTSPRGGTDENAYFAPLTTANPPNLSYQNRMFGGHWYIDGDHTGTNNAVGNNPPPAPGTTGGYMLAVNADYVASEAYRQSLTNLCPNTYYEFSAWFKNICPTCGADSLGKQFSNTAIVANQNGYPGVLPNLTFAMDGLDRYSTGEIDAGGKDLTGEQGGWVKKGFVFHTGPTQTTATLSIRNNAQGGGGNDWVMDDIGIATCFPSMAYSPSSTPLNCLGNITYISDTVRSQFNDYSWYVWQQSTDGGTTWTDITAPKTETPVYNNTLGVYEYIADTVVVGPYTNPDDTLTHSGDIYRVYTATALANITNPDCVANDGSAPITLTVIDCGIALATDLLSFNGKLVNNFSTLSWSTSKEEIPVRFELQRSDDNIHFTTITAIKSRGSMQSTNYYTFTDPQALSGKKWYRLVLKYDNGTIKYSQSIQLINIAAVDFAIGNVINPFSNQLLFTLITGKNNKVNAELIDMQGRVVRTGNYLIYQGTNSLVISNTETLASGIYTLRVTTNEKVLLKKVMKK